MDERDEFLSVDDFVVACVLTHYFVDFFFRGLVAYFLCDFVSEGISG